MMPEAARKSNRLAKETSPYLLQHAHNPVDWYAWGPEAFAAARERNKPIFLSVGYSTCYWCHVMERQCFENDAIARQMNEQFINIKVDREERPDVDQLYMTAVQVLTRHGGWPMSVFLTPDLKPFYGGTYFPPTDMHGRPGFPTLLQGISDAWRDRRKDVETSAEQLVSVLRRLARPAGASHTITIDDRFIDGLVDRSIADYEPNFGGFGSAPKFPRQTLLELLLNCYQSANGDRQARICLMVLHALNAMANGGIRDHLGGAFHRYSTDSKWLVPHFEIMLYDNAMLAWCYVEAYRQLENRRYAAIARDIFGFVKQEMTSPQGAFYTALDAEVNAKEGGSYLWTPQQVEEVLDADDAKLFNRIYGLDRGPNFADPHHGSGVPDANVLYLPDGPPSDEDEARLSGMRRRLYEARRQRKQPLLDTKIITSWNALMIRALAHAGHVLGEREYLDMGAAAAEFLLTHHRREDGTLFRTSRDGVAKYDAFLDDYAFLAQALIALEYAGAPGRSWKNEAAAVANVMRQRFGSETGGFYFTAADADDIIVRQMIGTDSPLPAGNGVAAMVSMDLDESEAARRTIAEFAAHLEQNAEGMSTMLLAAMRYHERLGSIEIAADAEGASKRPLSPEQIASSVVAVRAGWHDPRTLEMQLQVLDGFHINAAEAAPGLIATELRAVEHPSVSAIEMPPGESRRFAFTDEPIRVYDGLVKVLVRFTADQTGRPPVRLSLTYQACDESACLPAVVKQLEVPTP